MDIEIGNSYTKHSTCVHLILTWEIIMDAGILVSPIYTGPGSIYEL